MTFFKNRQFKEEIGQQKWMCRQEMRGDLTLEVKFKWNINGVSEEIPVGGNVDTAASWEALHYAA